MFVGYVEIKDYMPVIEELERRLGRSEAIRRVGVAKHTWYDWLDGSHTRAQRATIVRLEATLEAVRKNNEDRSERSIKRGAQARGEESRPVESRRQTNNAAEVVPTWQVSNILRAWLNEWRLERPTFHHNVYGGAKGEYYYSPLQWLSEKTGINIRVLSGYVANYSQHVSLEKVDAILQALEKTDLMQTEITVIPNPRWTVEKYRQYMAERGCV
jgi:hypothetical protein